MMDLLYRKGMENGKGWLLWLRKRMKIGKGWLVEKLKRKKKKFFPHSTVFDGPVIWKRLVEKPPKKIKRFPYFNFLDGPVTWERNGKWKRFLHFKL